MFYYTREFAAITDNIPDFIDQIIAETNQGKIFLCMTKVVLRS